MKFTTFFMGILMTVASWFGYAPIQVAQTAVPAIATSTEAASTTLDVIDAATSTLSNTSPAVSGGQASTQAVDPLAGLGSDKYADGILPLGDGDYVTSGPKKGYVYLCNVMSGGEGAQANGPWIGTNTWNDNDKVSVEGSVSWPNAKMTITMTGSGAGEMRVITTNDLPTIGTTGIFPISPSDPAYQYDENPNSIETQNLSFSLPANPTMLTTPGCIYGEVGVMTNGVMLLDAFDAEYRDAEAHEIQDSCSGHPHEGGMYHYHSLSPCIPDATVTNIIGWAFDGYPITGPLISAATATSSARYLTTADLDECHGITSPVMENGKLVDTYHYVMTQDFPYSVSCFRGKSYEPKPEGGSGAGSGGMNMEMGGSVSGMSGMDMSGNANNANTEQTPPAAAVNACASVAAGGQCSFNTPNGTISGQCQTPPNQTGLACVPNR